MQTKIFPQEQFSRSNKLSFHFTATISQPLEDHHFPPPKIVRMLFMGGRAIVTRAFERKKIPEKMAFSRLSALGEDNASFSFDQVTDAGT